MEQKIVKFRKVDPRAIMPKYQSPQASGFDLHCIEGMVLYPGETNLIRTGLAVELPPDTEMQILVWQDFPESPAGWKQGPKRVRRARFEP